jgi:hypothetical protein
MADATMVISNGIGFFGLAPSDLWNAHNWNAFLWGEGTLPMTHNVDKVIANISTFDSAPIKQTDKLIEGSFSVDSNVGKQPSKLISETIAPTADMNSEGLQDGTLVWNYVFQKPSTEAENRSLPTFTTGSNGTTVWTQASTSTIWS